MQPHTPSLSETGPSGSGKRFGSNNKVNPAASSSVELRSPVAVAETASTSTTNESDKKAMRPKSQSFLRRVAQWLGVKKSANNQRRTATKRRDRPYLTSAQLTDLFNRLDDDGNGELDEEEFAHIIEILKLRVSKEEVSEIFRDFKTDALNMQEFICAYQKIYSNRVAENGLIPVEEEFVRATRYGVDEDGKRVFELYILSRNKLLKSSKKVVFHFPEDEQENTRASVESLFQNAREEPWEGGSVNEIHRRARADSKANGEGGCRLLWWIDITLGNVQRSSVSRYIDSLGLPNNANFLSSFSNFGTPLPKDAKSRFFVGHGVTMEGLVTSMSFFLQSTQLKNRPVVHHFPPSLENIFSNVENKAFNYLKDYYTSRFAFMFNLSMLSNTHKTETWQSYENAESIAQKLREDAFDFTGDLEGEESDSESESDDSEDEKEQEGVANTKDTIAAKKSEHTRLKSNNNRRASNSSESHTIMNSQGQGVPLTKKRKHRTPPTWILSNTQLMKRRPELKVDTLSMHVMDHGSGPNTLITIRAVDDEQKSRATLEEKSRCGVLGRMLDGIWTKLLVVNGADGAADIAGELSESPMTLLAFISLVVHGFSMQSVDALDGWLSTLEAEIQDMAVSKHSTHLSEMGRIVQEYSEYVDSLLVMMSDFVSEYQKECEEILNAAVEMGLGSGMGGMGGDVDRSSRRNSGSSLNQRRGSRTATRRFSSAGLKPLPILTTPSESLSVATNTAAILELEKLPISYKLLRRFMGDGLHRDLKIMIEGYDLLELKGLKYWKERIEKHSARLTEMQSLIATQLDEKRNFTSFLLTIVTTLLAPLTILTGYFGMNFENMTELQASTYPNFPGVQLMWGICAFLYVLMFVYAIHARVLYSAT